MQTHILNLTNGAVNIFKDDGSFKSTYQIMKEIAAIYDTLDDVSAADLLETISGKQRANAVAALISNWSQVEAAAEASYNAAGTAEQEQQKYLESIQGHLNQLQASWEVLSASFMDSNGIKVLIDSVGSLLSGITEVVNNVGVIPTVLLAAFAAMSFKNVGRAKMFALKMVVKCRRQMYSI
jgi:TP901 family phage tail tape measure protein